MSTQPAPHAGSDLLDALRGALPADRIVIEDVERRYMSTDVFSAGELPDVVVAPQSTEEVQAVVRVCAERRVPVTVRGGGASYTGGYTHARPGGITIDTGRLNWVEVNETNATVTVGPGCTWTKLHETLSARGLRTPFWGPFSGLKATVGGSMSQNSISHGTGAYGTSAQSALAFEVVTGTGELLRTGSAGSARSIPFFRYYGPDMAGLFTGDCGCLGVKVAITLPLMRRHASFAAISFAYNDFRSMHSAMREIALEGLDDENFGLDSTLQQGQLGRNSGASAKFEAAKSVMKTAGSIGSGIKQLAKMATAGDSELRTAPYVFHYIVEGVDDASARAKAAVLRRIGTAHGEEITNAVPTVVRGMPFAPFTNVLGPKGERWVPFHALLSHEVAHDFHAAVTDYWDRQKPVTERLGIYHGNMFMAVGTSAFVYEPAMYWPDERTVYHERTVPEEHLGTLPRLPASTEGRDAIRRIRSEIIDIMAEHGAAHLQVGKVYPYLRDRNPASIQLLRAIKSELDPRGILNPGGLGL